MARRICAWCKIDLETGEQLTDEEYNLTCLPEAEETHGMCPDCSERATNLQKQNREPGHFDEPTWGQRKEYYRLFGREASSDLTRGEIGRLIRQGQRQR
ncbi:hypothetical protein LCGC14_1426990 [marine sediment metagenome]|uniref:Uncharacterized protein n=1 Tax=marine sediment metagenome TaxID=412755 RepID=A0A0F9JPP3_9ZZZZ